MSEVDERIVRMSFEHSGFENGVSKVLDSLNKIDEAINFDGAATGLEQVRKSMSDFNLDPVANALEESKSHFSAFEQFGIGVFRALGNEVVQFGNKILHNLTSSLTAGAKDGFKEYELQMGSLQTISANSGESMEVITQNLDELNEYADKTIYNFSQMTQNIGRFTAAGLDVEKSTKSIKGFANMAALAGAGTQETSRGMYQLSQAMAAGVVKLQDWKSIQNASIDTAAFKDILIETARVMGTEVDDAIEKQGSFNQSLQEGWLTADVMAQALEVATMSTRDFEDEEAGLQERLKQLTTLGYSEDVAKKLVQIANAADDSAREVRTWSQLVDTVKEAIGSGWSNTWKLVIGDFDQATELFTTISKRMDEIVSASAGARNNLLKEWQNKGGRDALIGIGANLAEMATRFILPLKDAFIQVFGFSGEQLAVFTENVAKFTEALVPSENVMNAINSVLFDIFTVAKSIIGVLFNAGRVLYNFSNGLFDALGPFVDIFTIWAPMLLGFSPIIRIALAALTLLRTGLEGTFTEKVIGVVANWSNKLHVLSDSWEETVGAFLDKTILKKISSAVESVKTFFTDNAESINEAKNNWVSGFENLKLGLEKFLRSLKVVFQGSDFYKTLVSWYEAIKQFISEVFPQSEEDRFKLFGHDLLWYIVTPASKFAELMQKFADTSGGNFVQWIHKVLDLISGPFSLAFKVVKFVVESMATLISGPLKAALSAIVDMFNGNFSIGNPFQTMLDAVNSFTIANPFSGFQVPAFVLDTISTLSTKFDELTTNTNLSTEGIKDWMKQLGTKIKTNGKNRLVSVLTFLSNTYETLVNYFSKFKGSGKSLSGIIVTVFSDILSTFKEWINKLATSSDGLISAIGKVLVYIVDKLERIPEILKSWFGTTKDALHESVDDLAQETETVSEKAGLGLMGLFDSLPSLSEIIVKIGTFFGNIKDEIVKGFSQLFSGGEENTEGAQAAMGSLFDFSRYKIVLPDLKEPVSNFITGISEALDLFPTDTIDNIVTKAGGWAKTIGTLWTWMNFNKWLGSLAVFNKGLEKEAGGIGDFFKELPEALSKGMTQLGQNFGKGGFSGALGEAAKQLKEGMTLFGKAIDPWGTKTKSRAFLQIAEGILMLAGALFVLSKIPAEDINRVAQAMAQMGIAVAGFALFVGWIAKLTGSDLQAVGAAVAGFGVGLIALVGALWLFTKIPMTDIEDRLYHFIGLIIALGTAVMLPALGSGNLFGAAAAFVALAAAVSLMAIPITILGLIPMKILDQGELVVGGIALVLTGCISVLSAVADSAMVLAAASVAMIAFAAAVSMMAVPIIILGLIPMKILDQGELIVGGIALVITGCMSVLSLVAGGANGFSMLAATVAMVGFAAAISLMIVPITILGLIPNGLLEQGEWHITIIGTIISALVALLSLISANAFTIVGSAVGIMAMNVALAGLVVIVGALSLIASVNIEAMKAAVGALVAMVISIGGLALTGFLGAGSLLALAGALLAFSAALGTLGLAIVLLQNMVDWAAVDAGMKNFTSTIAEMGHNIIAGIRDAIANAPGEMVRLAADMGRSFIEAIEEIFDMHSPSQVMAEEGDNIIQGLIDGIMAKLGELLGTGEGTGESFLEGVNLADIPGKLAELASDAVNNFVANVNTDAIVEKGEAVIQGFLDGLESEALTRVEEFPKKLFDSIVGGIKALFGINSPSTVMKEQAIFVLQGFIEGLADETLLGTLATNAANLGKWVLDGILGLPDKVRQIGADSVSALSGLEGEFDKTGSGSVMSMSSAMDGAASFVKASSEFIVTNASSGLAKLSSKFKDEASRAISAISETLSYGASKVGTAVSNIVSKAKDSLSSLYNSFYSVGSNGVQGFIDGLGSKGSALYNRAVAIGKSALDAIKKALGIASPSKEFIAVGEFSIEGLILGMDSQEKRLVLEGEQLAKTIPDAFANTLSALSVNIDDLIDTDYSPVITPVIDPTKFDSGMSYLNGVINGGLSNILPIGDMDYNAQFGGKLDDLLDSNRQVAATFASNSIDYTLLGTAVANALISAGVHVEMEGGELMGYLAGQIQDTRRMYR